MDSFTMDETALVSLIPDIMRHPFVHVHRDLSGDAAA